MEKKYNKSLDENKLLNKILKINLQAKQQESRTVIYRVFQLLGKEFNFGRVSYNDFDGIYHICVLEWKAKNAKSSIGYKLPDSIIKYFFNKPINVFNTSSSLSEIPKKLKRKIKPVLIDFFNKLDIETLIFIPVLLDNKKIGSITFDICKNQKEKPVIDKKIKGLLLAISKMFSYFIKVEKTKKEFFEYKSKCMEILENSNDGIFINEITENKKIGKIIEVNKKLSDLLKYKRDELTNKTLKDILSEDSKKDFLELEEQIIKKKNFIYELTVVDKKGKRVPVEINSRLFYSKGKKFLLSVLRDIEFRKKVEEKLKDYEKSHKILINQIGQLIYDYDVKSGKIKWEGAVEKITGYTEEAFNKMVDIKKWEEMIHPEDRKKAVDLLEIAKNKAGKYTAEYRFLHKNKNYVYVEDEGIFLKDENNKIYRMIGSMKDITQRKIAEKTLKESEERFKVVTEQANYGILIIKNGKVIYANDAISKILEENLEEIYKWNAKKFLELVVPEEKRIALLQMGDIAEYEGNVYNVQHRIITKTDKIKFIDIYFKKIFLEGNKADLVTVIDITKLKETENKLKMIIKELEKLNSELEQFVYIASHDLKEPLRMIASFVQLLERRYKNQIDKDADDFINYIVEGTRRMEKLINALLDYSRVGKAGEPKKELDVNEVIKKVLLNLQPMINEKKAVVNIAKLPVINAVEIEMMQIFQNLISNALIFSKKDEVPVINIDAKKIKNEIVFSVKDNGIGIHKDYHTKIFEIFKKLHPKNEYPGTGIGLSVCKKIVELNGGKIWVESEPGKGSTFYFTLPLIK